MTKVEKKVPTQKDLVLKYLQTHKKGINKKIAEEKFNIKKLSAVISALKKSGVEIISEEVVEKKTNEKYTRYTINNM